MINDKFMKKFFEIDLNDINEESSKEEKIINTMILDTSKIYYFKTISTYKQIEFLSLRNNFIKDISFIHQLPNLYYLDLFGNYLDNYKPLIKHGTFGFLSLSPPPNFFEKKILSLTHLNVIILEIDITDKSIYNNLVTGNPNILVFNNLIVEFSKKVRIFNTVIGLRYYIQNLLSDNEDLKALRKSTHNYNNIKNKNKDESLSLRDILLQKKFKIRYRNTSNPKCTEIINFFEEYNKILYNMYKSHKSNFDNDILLSEERIKILMIYKTLKNIGKYFSRVKDTSSKFMKDNKEIMTKKIEYHMFKFPNINIEIFSFLEFTQYKELVLSTIIMYLFGIFSNDISQYLILLMFKKMKYFHENEKNKKVIEESIDFLFKLDKVYLFCFYYKIYDILFGEAERTITTDNIYNVKHRLDMISITDKISEILTNQEQFIKHFNSNENVAQKNKIIIKDFIGFLFHMKIFPAIFNICQFINDFLIFNKLYNQLENIFPKDIHLFSEVQGLLLTYYNKYNEVNESIADKNYDKIQSKFLLANKFYFRKPNNTEKRIPYLIPEHKKFHANKKRILNLENMKPLHDIIKEGEKIMKQNYINNALKKYLTIKSEKKVQKFKKLKYEINNDSIDENKNVNKTLDSIEKQLYKTFNFGYTKNRNNNIDFNLNNSKEKMKTFYNSNISKLSTKSNSIKINNLKKMNILIDNTRRRNKYFNNNFLLNPFNSSNNCFDLLNKKKDIYKTEENKLISTLNENNEDGKELKQFSLTIDKKIQTKHYSIREFKKGYIISKYYNIENDKLKNIKISLDATDSKKYQKSPKFSSLFL